jgi:chromosome partitioning protein
MPPLVISVALLKGGVSKTTTALALAEAAAMSVPVVIIDTDPMGSMIRWAELAAAAGASLRSTVVSLPVTDLTRHFPSAARGAAVVVIDTPPPGALNIARQAVEVAHRIVMPVPPQLADLDRVPATVKIASGNGTPRRQRSPRGEYPSMPPSCR